MFKFLKSYSRSYSENIAINKARAGRELLIIVFDIYDRITKYYSTSLNVCPLEFYLDKIIGTTQYFYACHDFRDNK